VRKEVFRGCTHERPVAFFGQIFHRRFPVDAREQEGADGLDKRTAGLLSALVLARIDGKSPVEYITDPHKKEFVRAAAREFLLQSDLTLSGMAGAWHNKVSRL
jgi:hypothetical protein